MRSRLLFSTDDFGSVMIDNAKWNDKEIFFIKDLNAILRFTLDDNKNFFYEPILRNCYHLGIIFKDGYSQTSERLILERLFGKENLKDVYFFVPKKDGTITSNMTHYLYFISTAYCYRGVTLDNFAKLELIRNGYTPFEDLEEDKK